MAAISHDGRVAGMAQARRRSVHMRGAMPSRTANAAAARVLRRGVYGSRGALASAVADATDAGRLIATIGRLHIDGDPGDVRLMVQLRAAIAQSATGADILSRLARAGGRVQVLDGGTYDRVLDKRTEAAYDSSSGTIYLRRESLRANPKVAATVLAHEGTHLLDDARGLMDAAYADAARGAKLAQDSEEYLHEQAWELSMITESHAHMAEARVARELGVPYSHSYPGAVAPDGHLRTFVETWQALEQGPYNPDHRHATPRDR